MSTKIKYYLNNFILLSNLCKKVKCYINFNGTFVCKNIHIKNFNGQSFNHVAICSTAVLSCKQTITVKRQSYYIYVFVLYISYPLRKMSFCHPV